MKSIALQFIVNFIQFFSSICLIEGSFIENGKKLLIDQLYTEYILSPSLAYSSEIRACIKRMISIEYYDGTLNEFNESVKVKGIERLVDRDVCRFWALHRHMKQFHVKLIQFGEMITQNSIERFYAIFLEPNQCARLNHIRKTKDSKDKKWLMDFECDLADGHLFMLEEMLQNWHYAKQRKLAQVFLEQKADWENELTYRLRMIGYLKNLEDPNFLKTVAKHRMEELFGKKNANSGTLLYNKYPILTYGIDFFEWHYLLYAQLFAVEPSELSRIKAAMELFAYFHAIEMLFEQKAHPKSIWPTLRLDIARIFDSINSGTTKLFSLNESTDKARQLLAQVSKLKADFLQKKKAFVASSSKHTEALENPQLEADISRIRAELEHLITVEKTAAQNSEMFQILANLSELKLDMELYIKGIPFDYELNKINNIVTIQDELSQMHAEMIEKLATFNEVFCQKLHALCGVELTKRFSVILSQTQLAKIWPTVRMCRIKEAVNAGGWLQLTHEPSISFKNGEDTIEYHDDDASALAQSYKELFTNHELFSSSKSKFSSSTQHHQIQNMDILLKAAIWLGNNLIDEFLLFVDTMFEKENAVINQMLNNLWTLWDLLLKGTNEMDLTMINANEIDGIFTPHLSSIQLNCNAAQIAEHLNQLKDSPNYELVHSLTLFRLMKRLTQFRNIFSGSAEYVEAIKRSLFVVLGSSQEFELLEKMFPEHLRIDWLDKGYRVALYSNMLQQRSWSDEAQRAEMRMASSMLLRHLNVQLSAKTTIGTIDPMDVLRMHEIVKAKVYANIDKVEGVCWMMYLLNMMNRNGTFVVPSEPLVVYCVHEGARLHGFIAHWDKIQQWHYDFLTESKNGTPILVLMKHKVPGTMTRLWRLLGDKLFSELCKQYKEVCQYDASNKAFDDEHVLMYHYRRSIVFSEKVCAIDQLNSKLAADMLVFIRWFDAEPKSAKMATFWRAKREELKEEYDEIFDANLNDGLTQKILTFVQSCHSMKKLLFECRNWVNEKEMKEAWKKMLQRLANNDDRHRKHSGEGAERQRHAAFVEGKDWLNNLHAEELKKFLGFTNDGGEHKPVNEEQKKPREHFARIMREGLTKLMNARIQLLDFVGVKEAVNIFKMLGIKSELDDLDDELFKDAHIQDSGEKKNKKKKKKQKKKTKMTNTKNRDAKAKRNKSAKNDGIDVKNNDEMTARCHHIIDEIKEDEFLLGQYLQLLSNPSAFNVGLRRTLLEMSIYSNEIWHRIEVLKHFAKSALQFLHWPEHFESKWRELKEKNVSDMEEEELKMKLNKLAKALMASAALKNAWDKLTKADQICVITVIFVAENNNRKLKEAKRKSVGKYMEKWGQTLQQIRMDQHIFEMFDQKGLLNFGQKPAEWREHIEYIQQINYDGESNFSDEMAFILRANGHGGVDTDTKTQIQAHFDTIRTIVKQWSKGQGELLMGGSMMMGTFTSDSDVDTVCVVPEHIRAEHFFGTVSCHKKFNKECRNDDSLFCQLCLHPDVQSLQKLPSSWVPLIRLTLSTTDHELDIAFASILGDEQIQFEDQNILEKTEEMIDKLGNKIKTLKHDQSDQSAIDESEQLLRSLRSLAGINSNLRMLELVSDNEIFRKFILALKLWAKSNYIYNNAMGFLNGTSLSILATKIVLLYPEATVPFLLKRFFFTYIKWEWPLPVHIEDIRPDSLNWNAADELRQLETQFWLGSHGQRLTMPVITSGYPQQNSTFKINWQTEKIIKNAMQKALKVLHSSKSDKEKWTTILEQQKKFSEMYPYYFVITCVASDVNLFNEFCGFVVTRIRIQLLRTIDCSRDSVEFCHVLALNSCPQYTVQKYTNISANMCCKAWLVGVSVKKAENGQQLQNIDLELNNNNLKTNLDNAIVASYKKIVFDTRRRRGPLNLAEQKIQKFFSSKFSDEKNQRDFVRLETKYVDKSTIT
uniref:polynucleotide adenylyltransferase n=1 Tax=Globodera rostochiensis TaxID=31243 RepID=A0A914H4D1_GLORO